MTYTYSWTHEGTALTDETSATLTLSSFSMDDVGTYSCRVGNDAGTGIDSITIRLGGEAVHQKYNTLLLAFSCNIVAPHVTSRVSPPGPVVEGATVNIICEATAGDLPISYS